MTRLIGHLRQHLAYPLLAGLLWLAAFALLGADLLASRDREIARHEREMSILAEMLERHIADTIGRIDIILSLVADDYDRLSTLTPEAANRELADYLRRIPESQSLRIGDAEGFIRIDASGTLPSSNIADRAYVQRLRNDPQAGLVLSEPIFARYTHNWVITLSRRLASPDGRFIGHVQAAINARKFGELFSRIVREPGDLVALYDREMRLIARSPERGDLLGKVLPGTVVEKRLAAGSDRGVYVAASPADQIERHFAYRATSALPLTVIVGRTEQEMLTEWRGKLLSYGGTLLLLTLVLARLLWAWHLRHQGALEKASALSGAYQDMERRAHTLLESIPDPAWLRNADGRFLLANQAYLDMCGQSREAVIGHTIEEVWPMPHAAAFRRRDDAVLQSGKQEMRTATLAHPDGRLHSYEYVRSPVVDGDGVVSAVAGFARDVTAVVEAETQAHYIAHHDPLTGLPRLSVLRERMGAVLAEEVGSTESAGAGSATGEPSREGERSVLALMVIDLDHFKNVNDTLGHAAGDRLIKVSAERLQRLIEPHDLLVRQGGDEFALLLPGAREDQAAQLAEKLLATLTQPFVLDGEELHLAASIGIALYPADGANLEALRQNADAALYEAKAGGRGTYRFFKPEMNARVAERLKIESRLRRALPTHRLALVYQPQMALESGRVLGVEALLRWEDPELGNISPARFIPLAEETGLIRPIGEWVLNEACRQMARWQQAGCAPDRMAVNLSAVQLADPGIVDTVRGALAAAALPPACLELEITESALMSDPETALGVLREFRTLGVRLAIDDFGTGYSNFATLKHMPINVLKIDRSFVVDIDRDDNDAAIVQAIIAVARTLGLETLAEGVETADQLACLNRFGCEEAQGYHFSRPLTPDAAQRYLTTACLAEPAARPR